VSFTSPLRPLPPEPPPKPSTAIVRARFDFKGLQQDDLSFKKGDLLEVIGDSESNDWWIARHLATGREGYIPSNYVAKDDNNPESQEWWFPIDRRETDKLLLLQGNPRGTFLVRPSSDLRSYAMSIRDFDEEKKDITIKHYRIRKMDNGGCYISPKKTFSNMLELIEHYKVNADGLCYKLTKACPKEPEPVPFMQIEVDRSSLRLAKRLGAGQFGEVWQGKWRNNVDVAVKTLKPGQMSVEAFLEEARIMHKLRHRKLVQLMGVCTKEEPVYIITELMVHGALLDFLRNDTNRNVKLKEMVDIGTQIADGMAYLEDKNYIHRDLRAANILVNENLIVKVADFGLARLTSSGQDDDNVYLANEATKFPIKWTAPEAAYERKFTIKSDVWSYGILLYEIITYGRLPYPGMTGSEVLQSVERGYRMPKPENSVFQCPDSYYDMMLKCWNKQPESRPTFRFLYDYFDDYFVATEPSYRETV